MNRPTCATCRFFDVLESQCHRQQPAVFFLTNAMGQQTWTGTWPPVRKEAWCGEHQPEPPPAPLGLPS